MAPLDEGGFPQELWEQAQELWEQACMTALRERGGSAWGPSRGRAFTQGKIALTDTDRQRGE